LHDSLGGQLKQCLPNKCNTTYQAISVSEPTEITSLAKIWKDWPTNDVQRVEWDAR